MRINWFKDENHLVYINGATQLAELEKAGETAARFAVLEARAAERTGQSVFLLLLPFFSCLRRPVPCRESGKLRKKYKIA